MNSNDVTVRFGGRTFSTPADGRNLQSILDEVRPVLRFGDNVRINYRGEAVSSPQSVVPVGGTTIDILTAANSKA